MGSSYLSEVLGGGGDDTLPDIHTLISEVIQQINILKKDVKAVVDEGYINFKPFVRENDRLKSQAQTLINEMNETQKYIENDIRPEISNCAIELEKLSGSLQEINISLAIISQLSDIYSAIKNAGLKIKNKEFYACSEIITDLRQTIKSNQSNLNDIEIFKVLSQETTLLYEQLIHQINEVWSSYVCFDIEQNEDSTNVTLTIDIENTDEICEILKAANCLNYNQIEKRFSHTILNSVINEIILKKVNVTDKITDKATLTIEIFKSNKKPYYMNVFEDIMQVIEFLKEHININFDDYSFLLKIGSNIATEFADNLIKNCLSETIPTKSEDLERYTIVVKNAEEFQEKLQGSGFLPVGCTSFVDYAKNINVLFANKFCQSYLEKARGIMKKDLHNTTNTSEVVLNNLDVLPINHRNILKSKLKSNQDVIRFPKCQISKSAEELLSLAQTMMDELVKSQDLCAVRLFYTVRNIFEMYSAVVPLHHKKFLETLPQQVAIFHNNCLYFTYQIVNITCEYLNKCPKILKDHFTILLEEAISLRSLAIDTLESHVASQRNQIVYILRDSGLATLNEEPKLNPNSEKNVRQCIRQLQILQTVWHDVLPANVYHRVMGFLLDSFTEEIVRLIIVVEDISSDTALELVAIFSVVLEKAPSLFNDPKEIYRHTKKWQKFNEFVLVLKGNLRDIDDRWSNGMGPLANEFTPEQVKHLIRALFQNSERRAALLSRIK